MAQHLGPRVSFLEPSVTPRGVAVVLHGGKVKSHSAVRANQLAVLRMRPFVTALHAHGQNLGLAVASVLFGVRGWNGVQRSPVGDVERVLESVEQRYGSVPVTLVGHSMGGRAALYAAGAQSVAGVIGLAPWIERDDPYEQLADRKLLIVHGSRDRITDVRASRALVQRVQGVSRRATFIEMQREGHAMIRRPQEWHELTTEFTLDQLGLTSGITPATNILQTAASGVTELTI